MSFDRNQFASLIQRSCARRRLDSPSATQLILATAAQESGFGTYIRQINGPALGVYQMERPTFDWVHNTCIPKHSELSRVVFPMLEWDLDAATFLCRLRYKLDPLPLPEVNDVAGMWTYYKRDWNSMLGKATEDQFRENWERYKINF